MPLNDADIAVRAARRWIARLVGLVLLLVVTTVARGQSCTIPTGFPMISGSNDLRLDNSTTVNGVTISGSGNALTSGGSLTTASATFPALSPSTFPSTSSSTNGNTSPVAAGQYSGVSASGSTFVLTGGTYYIKNLNVNSSTLQLGPGTYYVENLSLSNNVTITAPSGGVRLYIKNSVGARNDVVINPKGNPDDFVIFVYPDAGFELGNTSALNGIIYSPGKGTIKFGNTMSLTGAVVGAARVEMASGAVVTFTDATAAAVAATTACRAPTLEYRFDECSYSGTTGEVTDSAGVYPGTARNKLTTTGSAEIARAAAYDSYEDWVSTSIDLGSEWTVATWIDTSTLVTKTGSRYHILAAVAKGGDLLYLDNLNKMRWGVYTTGGTTDGTYLFSSLSSGWHHVAITGTGGVTRLYVDGSLVDQVSRQVTGTLTYVGTSFDSVDTTSAQGIRMSLDEFKVWSGAALVASEISRIYSNENSGLNHDGTKRVSGGCGPSGFLVTASASASTCTGQSVTIRALDAVGGTMTTYVGTVTVTTSTGGGGWAVGSGKGTLTETGTTNDGAATYAFSATDAGQAVLSLSNQSADDLTITARDSTTTTITGTSGTVSFRNNAFVISATDSLANTVVAGRSHAMQVALWRRDTSLATPNCAIATNYTGARNLKAWYTTDASHPAGATAPSITGTLGTAVPSSNNLALTFTAGVATFNLGTSDVGKYVLNIRDDSRTFAGAVNIDGSSPTLTVRPFAIAVTNAVRGGLANPEGTATSGAKFAAAGETFAVTVGAYLWAAADDTNNDGAPDSAANVTDNALAPRFAWPVVLSATNTSGLFTPTGGTLGTLGGTTTVATGSFVNGAAVPIDLTYSEVGSIGLSATVTGYLGTSGVDLAGVHRNVSTGAAARIGRFHPASFALSGAAVTPSCSAGNQTYMGEPALGIALTLQARNVSGGVTTNYRASVYNVGTVTLHAENADAGTNLAGRVTGLPSVVWTLGAYSLTATGATFARSASPDGPFDSLVLGVSVTDADGAVVSTPDMNAATAGACGTGCNARALNGSSATRLRFGRLKIGNALGAPQLDLPVPLTAQYWNGVAFVTNAQDSCTRLTNTQFTFGNYRAPLAACTTSGSPAGANGIVFTSGRGTLRLSKPNVRGSVDLTANLGATASGATCSAGSAATATAASRTWLQGNWGASTWDRNPAGRAVFGVAEASPDVIYQRENY